jgi:hypothetical protein
MNAMVDYSHRDILAARRLHSEIKKVLKAHEWGERSDAMLQDIKVLCSCIIQTIRDPYCQEKMWEVEIHSDELFAVDNRPRWGRSSSTQPNSMSLRRLILRSLEAFEDRLAYLEAERESARAEANAEIRISL